LIELKNIEAVYFIGIGGIGMSALARYFHSRGSKVSGYDKTETDLTRALQRTGIDVTYADEVSALPKDVQLVVYTPAVPPTHQGLNFYRDNNYPVLKRSEILEIISRGSFNICIGGTHGKTTITTMVAHILRHSGYGCNAFLGGISVNYNSNFWSDERNVSVIEADEYDRSFLKLNPDIAVITAMDPDHLDIYGTAEALEEAFIQFASKVKPGGLLLTRFGLKKAAAFKASNHLTYSLQNNSADVFAENIRMMDGGYRFDVLMKDNAMQDVKLNMGGMHNVENAIAAIAVASYLEIENEKISAAVDAFRGVKRRFQYIIKTNAVTYIDDYAHHPEELKALISGASTLFKGKKCTVIFQPHLFSRTRDFADEFAASLDLADEVILLPIYPARELPIAGVTSDIILDKMKIENKRLLSKDDTLVYIRKEFIPRLDERFGSLLITAGAGDIDTMVEPIKQLIEKEGSYIRNA
jgi:UDP-N-acetylmuramate--alanine ligase